jgi:hypothetical protein
MDIKPGFLPDMGMAMTKAGLVAEENGKKYWQMFMEVRVNFIGKIRRPLHNYIRLSSGKRLVAHADVRFPEIGL